VKFGELVLGLVTALFLARRQEIWWVCMW